MASLDPLPTPQRKSSDSIAVIHKGKTPPINETDRPEGKSCANRPGAPIRSEGERYARELHAVTPTIQQNGAPAALQVAGPYTRAIPRRGPGDGNSAPSPRVRKAFTTKEAEIRIPRRSSTEPHMVSEQVEARMTRDDWVNGDDDACGPEKATANTRRADNLAGLRSLICATAVATA